MRKKTWSQIRSEGPISPLSSRVLRSVTKANTRPELIVRKTLHSLGVRFRLHRKDLPGTPDVVLRRFGLAIQVHGCFWHQHQGCHHARLPRTRIEYWHPKLARNVQRDSEATAALRAIGWQVLVVWECETKNAERLKRRLSNVLLRADKRTNGRSSALPRSRMSFMSAAKRQELGRNRRR
jgi:DNA mismatch endonuclease (patch repair protein)